MSHQLGRIALILFVFCGSKSHTTRADLRNHIDVALETIYETSLPALEDLKLIKETRDKKFPFTVRIHLTEIGKRVAEKVVQINDLLNS